MTSDHQQSQNRTVREKGLGFCYSFFLATLAASALMFSSSVLAPPVTPGDLAPYGNPDGTVNTADYLILQRMVMGQLIPTPGELLAGDVAPLGSPDSNLNAGDLVVLMRAINGLVTLPNLQPVAPTLTVNSESTDSTPYTVTGTTDPNTQINLYVNNQYQGTIYSDSSGNFSISATLNEGSNDLYVTTTVSGVESAPSTTITIYYDDFDILMSVVVMLASLPQAPNLDVPISPVNTPTVSVSGTATPGFGVNIYVNDVLAGQGAAEVTTGVFNVTGVAVRKGPNTIYAEAVSVNGVVGISSEKVTVVRSNQPQKPVLNLITVSYAGGGQITVSGSAGAAIGGYQVNISTNVGYTGMMTANADGSFSTTFVSGGASNMSLWVVDEDGVSSISVSRGIGSAAEESLNAEVLAVWNGFCTQLNNGDAAAAVNYFSVASKTNYARIFDVIGTEIENLTGYWSQVVPLILTNDYAEYAVKQTANGQARLHIIGFSRDSNGQWMIEQL